MTSDLDLRLAIGLGFLGVIACAMAVHPSPAQGSQLHVAICRAVDGDTLSCRDMTQKRFSIRLSAIDAPELPGHCRKGRNCAPGDPLASKANLQRLVEGLPVSWRPISRDRYGRTVALPYVGSLSLSCAQLQGGFAIYWKRYDAKKRLARSCAAAR